MHVMARLTNEDEPGLPLRVEGQQQGKEGTVKRRKEIHADKDCD